MFSALCAYDTMSIKLLDDCRVTDKICTEGSLCISSPKLTFDLNGHEFYIEPSVRLDAGWDFTIKDSSKKQMGRFAVAYIEQEIDPEDGELAKFTLAGGELYTDIAYFKTAEVTVSGGKVNAMTYFGVNAYAKLNISGGTIDGIIYAVYSQINITGGKFKNDRINYSTASEQTLWGDASQAVPTAFSTRDGDGVEGVILINCFGTVSGGEFEWLGIDGKSDDKERILLSGGSFDELYMLGVGNSIDSIEKGCALYSNSNLSEPIYAGDTKNYLSKVCVQKHDCEFDEDGECDCGRLKANTVAADKTDDAVAKVVYKTESGEKIEYPTTAKFFADLTDVKEITLLKDLNVGEYRHFTTQNSDITLDLNGHVLSGVSVLETQMFTIVVKDSSEEKTGTLSLYAMEISYVGKFVLESGKIAFSGYTDPDSDHTEYADPVVYGSLEIRGGEFDAVDGAVWVQGGRLTVSGGVLKCNNVYLAAASGAVPMSLDTLDADVTANETGDTMLISGGRVAGDIYIDSHATLKMTGGEVSLKSSDDTENENEGASDDEENGDEGVSDDEAEVGEIDTVFIILGGGRADISGGTIDVLMVSEYSEKAGEIRLSGGTFGQIYYREIELSDMLEKGYAYYKKDASGSGYNTLLTLLSRDDAAESEVYYISDVRVKAHVCSFDGDGKCACGRVGTANIEVVPYIDAGGNTAYCEDYTRVTSETTALLDNEWFVVDGNVTIQKNISVGDNAHLILKDGSTLTVKEGISETSLSIYAQSVGNTAGRLVANGSADYSTDTDGKKMYNPEGISIFKLTINGGNITAKGYDYTNASGKDIPWTDAIYVKYLTMNGGVLNATAGKLSGTFALGDDNWSLSCVGIYCVKELTVNGGIINAKGGDADVTLTNGAGAYVGSEGIECHGGIQVNDGALYAEGGTVKVTKKSADTACEVGNYGFYCYHLGIDDGSVTAKGGSIDYSIAKGAENYRDSLYAYGFYVYYSATVRGGSLSVSLAAVQGNANRNNIYTYAICVGELAISDGTVTATNQNAGYGCDAYIWDMMYMEGGELRSERAGGAVCAHFNTAYFDGGSVKLADSQIVQLYLSSDIQLKDCLSGGYFAYRYDTETRFVTAIDSDSEDDEFEYIYIAPAAIDAVCHADDTQTAHEIDFSAYAAKLGNDIAYSLGEYNYEDIELNTESLDKTNKMTFKLKEGAENGQFIIPVHVEGNNTWLNVFVCVTVTDKGIPTIGLTKTVFEKTYDGKPLSVSCVAEAATVKDGEKSVDGEWRWEGSEPICAGDVEMNAVFYPTESTKYVCVSAKVKVKISKAQTSGDPTYSTISESGKTLNDARLTANENWPTGTLKWVDGNGNALDGDTSVTQGTSYKWEFCPTDFANISGLSGSVVLWQGGGHSGSASRPNTAQNNASSNSPSDDKTNDDSSIVTPDNDKEGKKEFGDVHKVGHWAEKYIDYVVALGIMNGVSESEFAPDEELTRGMLVTVLYRLAGEPSVEGDSGFDDIRGDEWYAKAVAWAKQSGIVSGISERIFAAEENITREQIVTIIYRFAK